MLLENATPTLVSTENAAADWLCRGWGGVTVMLFRPHQSADQEKGLTSCLHWENSWRHQTNEDLSSRDRWINVKPLFKIVD